MHIEDIAWAEPHEIFHAFAHEPFSLLLDSATARIDPAPFSRWSFIALDPFEQLVVEAGGAHHAKGQTPFDVLRDALRGNTLTLPDRPDLPPFCGGAAGYFSYDLAHALERLPAPVAPFAIDDHSLPIMALGLYDTIIAFDHHQLRAQIISNGLPEVSPQARITRARHRAHDLRHRLETRQRPGSFIPKPCPPVTSNFTKQAYEHAVTRIIDYIKAGDIFQANFAQRFESLLEAGDSAYDLYLRLRALSPAPFSAFFNFGNAALASSSPERFLSCRMGRVETKPIKGTRPRGHTPDRDAALAAELLASEKDRAENVMIVDLLRNDLSRVCADHSVIVENLCALESFANVHHLVSTITGRLAQGMSAVDLLEKAYPGGSITGAPKLRAMEIIAELEPTTRGPYCGSIGYIGFDGTMDTSITIRTMIVQDRRVTFQAGGGITADSIPAQEYTESLDKADAMMRALGPVEA